ERSRLNCPVYPARSKFFKPFAVTYKLSSLQPQPTVGGTLRSAFWARGMFLSDCSGGQFQNRLQDESPRASDVRTHFPNSLFLLKIVVECDSNGPRSSAAHCPTL